MFFNWDRSAVMVAVHSSMLIKKKDPMAGCFGKFGYHPAVLISEASVMWNQIECIEHTYSKLILHSLSKEKHYLKKINSRSFYKAATW